MVEFSKPERALRERLFLFVQEEVVPRAAEIDERREVPQDLRRRLSQEGCFGRLFPKEVGGEGGTAVELCIQEEMLAYGSMAVSNTTMASTVGGIPICFYGTPDQQKRWLEPLIRAEARGAIGITERRAGSDINSIESHAYRDGDQWVLNGHKCWIGQAAWADFVTVWVKTSDTQPPRRGISTFVIETSRPGYKLDEVPDLMGLRGVGVGHFTFTDVRVPPDNLIGEENTGWAHVMHMLNYARIGTGAILAGSAQAALDHAKRYAKERMQFGQPIAQFQAIQFKIADMAIDVLTSRLLTFHAARMLDRGESADREAAMAKLYPSEAHMRVAHQALQIHGAWGFDRRNAVERIFRDARTMLIGDGTSEIHRLNVARRELEL